MLLLLRWRLLMRLQVLRFFGVFVRHLLRLLLVLPLELLLLLRIGVLLLLLLVLLILLHLELLAFLVLLRYELLLLLLVFLIVVVGSRLSDRRQIVWMHRIVRLRGIVLFASIVLPASRRIVHFACRGRRDDSLMELAWFGRSRDLGLALVR